MDIFAFNNISLESELADIRRALTLLHFSLYGFNRLELIDNRELACFESLIADASDKLTSLLWTMQLLGSDDDAAMAAADAVAALGKLTQRI